MVPCSTFRHLTDDEVQSPDNQELWKAFAFSITSKLGTQANLAEFPEEQVTPEWERYEDTVEGQEGLPENSEELDPEELVATPKVGDNYVNAEFLLSRGGFMERGQVMHRKLDSDGNPIGRINTNPILDTSSRV